MIVVAGVLLSAGTLLVVLAAVGLVRLPDVYSRLNAAAKAAGLGIVLVLLGFLVAEPSWPTAIKVLLAAALQLVTVPVGSYALGRAAYRARVPFRGLAAGPADPPADRPPAGPDPGQAI